VQPTDSDLRLTGEKGGQTDIGNWRLRNHKIRAELVVNPSAVWHSTRMQRREIVEKLRTHRAELCAAGIVHLRLHGSVARGEASSNSDVDLIAEFEPGRRLTLIDMVKLENRLRDLLGVKVDLSPANTLKEPVRRRAEREAVLAF